MMIDNICPLEEYYPPDFVVAYRAKQLNAFVDLHPNSMVLGLVISDLRELGWMDTVLAVDTGTAGRATATDED